MINEIKEMNPCHNPIQKPAGFISKVLFPAAQELRNKIAIIDRKSHFI